MSFQKLAMWFWKRDVNNVEKNGFRHSQCVVSKRHVGLYVESKLMNVESKLLSQLLLCEFDICYSSRLQYQIIVATCVGIHIKVKF
jgi:hypothetical protein